MKKIFTHLLILFFILMVPLSIIAQEAKPGKKLNQSTLQNEVYVSYGLGSLYIFTNGISHSYDYPYNYLEATPKNVNSWGTVGFGYNRMLNRIVMIGFEASYLNCNYTRKQSSNYGNDTTFPSSAKYNENILNGIAKLTLNYINKPSLRIYSSFGIGISILFGNASATGYEIENARKILPAGQLTMLGVRFGRSLGGFFEFGFGSNAIITGGISFQLKDSYEGE